MTAEILSIGDELLIGQVINSNQAYIAEQLGRIGVRVHRMTTVGDNEQDILAAFQRAWESHDVIVTTGGLGPTDDDLTRQAVCKFFQTDLIEDAEALANIERLFQSRGLAVTPLNRSQALVPRGCKVLQNLHGTAPGYMFQQKQKIFVVLPGVPFEMKAMMENDVLPFLRLQETGEVIIHRTLKTTGIPESYLAEKLGPSDRLIPPNSGLSLAYLPSPMGVRLRMTAIGPSEEEATRAIQLLETAVRAKAGKYIYGADEEELEAVVGRLLTERKLSLAVAESCTGGLIADRLTDVPGSSDYFERAVIAYSNDSKVSELGVPRNLIREFGAVSREVAEAMAFGIRKKASTDIGLSTTGIAGPSGGTAEKPVGLVWIGYSDRNETLAVKFNFGDERRRVKQRASQAALELLRRKLLKVELSGF